jgi:hypothetical protein
LGCRFAGRPPGVSFPSTGGAQLSALSVSRPSRLHGHRVTANLPLH